MESLKFVKGFTRIRKVRAYFIQGRDLKRATDFERSKSVNSHMFANMVFN